MKGMRDIRHQVETEPMRNSGSGTVLLITGQPTARTAQASFVLRDQKTDRFSALPVALMGRLMVTGPAMVYFVSTHTLRPQTLHHTISYVLSFSKKHENSFETAPLVPLPSISLTAIYNWYFSFSRAFNLYSLGSEKAEIGLEKPTILSLFDPGISVSKVFLNTILEDQKTYWRPPLIAPNLFDQSDDTADRDQDILDFHQDIENGGEAIVDPEERRRGQAQEVEALFDETGHRGHSGSGRLETLVEAELVVEVEVDVEERS
ncbi:hypothetical protein BDV25DRAFT_135413 [Aspergillus avenaceus]|uniref:Uncharacterized protein n=1 Tax=Aspergillus avenaceus TaxID=36643 RepID=A0A5N6U8M9_ASPAV|nr:hypothetical protein BDV25DRAFT_135413 [Aspergillus avenaceus]